MMLNVLDRLPERDQVQAKTMLKRIPYIETRKERWQHLRTANPVESPFASLRLRADAAKRHKWIDRV